MVLYLTILSLVRLSITLLPTKWIPTDKSTQGFQPIVVSQRYLPFRFPFFYLSLTHKHTHAIVHYSQLFPSLFVTVSIQYIYTLLSFLPWTYTCTLQTFTYTHTHVHVYKSKMASSCIRHITLEANCGFARCAIRELTPKTHGQKKFIHNRELLRSNRYSVSVEIMALMKTTSKRRAKMALSSIEIVPRYYNVSKKMESQGDKTRLRESLLSGHMESPLTSKKADAHLF